MNIRYNLTEKRRSKYPYHTDESICGHLYIKRMSSKRILNFVNNKDAFNRLHKRMGLDVNPNWIWTRLKERLYDRGVIAAKESHAE